MVCLGNICKNTLHKGDNDNDDDNNNNDNNNNNNNNKHHQIVVSTVFGVSITKVRIRKEFKKSVG